MFPKSVTAITDWSLMPTIFPFWGTMAARYMNGVGKVNPGHLEPSVGNVPI